MDNNVMDNNVTDNSVTDYSYDEPMAESKGGDVQAVSMSRIRMQYIVVYLIVCTLGMILNFYVITTACRVYHKFQKSPPSVWILALAVTHLVFSAFLVLQFLYAWYHFNWHYGEKLCKISSYVIYASMFSTAALLSLWSVSSSIGSCCADCRIKCDSRGMSLALVLSSWTFGALLSSPSLLSRELRFTVLGEQCIDDYDLDKEKTTDYGVRNFTAVVLSRFLLGILVPVFLMTISACLARRQDHDRDGSISRVTCAIKVAYFICWSPLLVLGLFQISENKHEFVKYGLPGATMLAAVHSVINPVIYLLVGRKINMRWMVVG